MSRRSPFVIDLADEDRQRLEAMVRRGKTELRMAIRAWVVLEAAASEDKVDIAEHLGVALNTVIKWRKRFFEDGSPVWWSGNDRVDPDVLPLWRSPKSSRWPVSCPRPASKPDAAAIGRFRRVAPT
jgi:hypothetical protein